VTNNVQRTIRCILLASVIASVLNGSGLFSYFTLPSNPNYSFLIDQWSSDGKDDLAPVLPVGTSLALAQEDK
jgi:hypothetical protein